jgi:membrane protein DedA with SNARE-associated domain
MTEMLIQHLETAARLAPVWGFVMIFIFMTIESSFIPFPSEVVMIPAGFLAARGELTFGSPVADAIAAVLVGVAGSLAGAYINYYLARWLGRPFLYRYGKYFFLSPHTLQRAEELFREYGAGITFACRMVPAIRQVISIPAGIAGMPLGIFTLCTGLGAGIWVAILTAVGYVLGMSTAHMSYSDLVHQGEQMVRHNLVWILLGCAVFLAVYIWIHKLVMKSPKTTPTTSAE